MTLGRVLLLVVVTACSSGSSAAVERESPDTSSRPTFTSAGRVYSVTNCPSAANLISGGRDAADALPKKGQTDRGRVESLLADAKSALVGTSGIVALRVIPRNGEVWDGPGNGNYTVEAAEDYQYEVLLGPDGSCPNSPVLWNGIPLLYNRAPSS
ncbi:MAG: hypothetical protein HKN07_03875 [Acidimicrobiia bacterium]|nr:hypothetical protein [Acidimicrobiia bacterium]NNF63375.1 hypothetical protein [Acidimicrobiia bacterium]